MRKLLILIFIGIAFLQAQDQLRIKMKDGSVQTIPLQFITKITFSDVTIVDENTLKKLGGALRTFTLLQNYPNPFNPTTTITYTIPATDEATIRIYDITGKLVRLLASGVQAAGEHQIKWEGNDNAGRMVASGVYLYEIRYRGFVHSRKLMLLK